MNRTFRLGLFLVLLLLILHIPSQEVSASATQTFHAYQITIKGSRPHSIGILPYFIITVKPYWRVNGSSPGDYRLLYRACHSYYNITNWTFKYVNLTNLPGVTHKLGNVTLPWPTNSFDIFAYNGAPLLHWQAKNGTTYDYLTCNYAVPVVVTHYTMNSQLVGHVKGEYVVFNGSNTTFKVPVKGLLKYYPKQLLNDLGGVVYSDVVYIWNSTTASYKTIHRKCFLVYPLHLSYWKSDGKVYAGVNFSKGVELKANQSIPILLYLKGRLKPLVDVLRLITPQGDPLRNLKNPVIAEMPQTWITPLPAREFFFEFFGGRYSRYVSLSYSMVSNGSSAILVVTMAGWIPYRYPYLVVNGVPRFFNISPTWGNAKEPCWWHYEFRFGVWRKRYELLWEEFSPVLNSSTSYILNGTCWRLINNFHNSSGFVANGTVEGNYMVFRFNGTTLRIPLSELAEYYPPEVWEWHLAAAKDGKGYLIIPTAGFDYGNYYYAGGPSFGLVLGPGDYLFPVDNSSGVYALYYVNGTLKPAFDLLRLMSPQGDWIRNLPNFRILPNLYFNSSVSFGICRGEKGPQVGNVTVTRTSGTGAKESHKICGPGLVTLLAVIPVLRGRLKRRVE
ncbi:hypothetical protein APY94_04635 [Thermococcus celericrescens]|uniref:Thermopsin n=1 Tax=Thermococcus celericrescens TaxID=227598 RepID=A0A100XYA4_9EURY|nr:CGP-CTERM sorting domain-containing protein [Thermococcus celericrescens]KUH33813.1 hypothetical protein APY94_04635 [Thermococcus celericrescens]